MDGRIVVSFRAVGPGRGLLDRARALDARAGARGGVLVGWSALRATFAFPPDGLKDAIALAATRGDDTRDGERPFCVGIAQGDLKPLAEDGTRGDLAWGPAFVAAEALAGAARPGEIVCAQTLRALRTGELLTVGTRIARVHAPGGAEERRGPLRVRGVVVDGERPWRKQAVEQLATMRVAPLVGVEPLRAELAPGSLVVLRADPGAGGTRWLTELAAATPRSLLVSPVGSGYEPLGALRRALGRSITRELSPLLLQLAAELETLLSGDGVSLEVATSLVSAFLAKRAPTEKTSLLLVDDAKAVDPASLEACVRAVRAPGATFAVVVRLDASGSIPTALASLPRSAEVELAPLERDAAEALAGGCTNDALDATARKRWARLGANLPLGIVEAVAWGVVSGDLAWKDGKAKPRSLASGRGKVRASAEWIGLRARDETLQQRTLLALVALLGGEAKVARLARILERAGHPIDVDAAVEEAIRSRWLVDTQEDWVGLPSRTHRDALVSLVDDAARKMLYKAAADVVESEEGVYGKVEAAWQYAQSGQLTRASPLLLAAARATAQGKLDASTTQLIAAARRIDPSCEKQALELLGNAVGRAPSVVPAPPAAPPRKAPSAPPMRAAPAAEPAVPAGAVPPVRPPSMPPPAPVVQVASEPPPHIEPHDSEPPTIAKLELAPKEPAIPGAPAMPTNGALAEQGARSPDPPPVSGTGNGSNIATRLGELAKEALLSADNAALERWVDGLSAAGESPVYTERMRAMVRLGRGDIGDALRVLRRTRAQIDPKDHRLRCQTSLAMGVALSVAGRHQEALLEGLDALARARQIDDEAGARACVAFLAKLYVSAGKAEEAERLREAAAPPTS